MPVDGSPTEPVLLADGLLVPSKPRILLRLGLAFGVGTLWLGLSLTLPLKASTSSAGYTDTLEKVWMHGSSTGWGIGVANGNEEVQRTTDGGRLWTAVTIQGMRPAQIKGDCPGGRGITFFALGPKRAWLIPPCPNESRIPIFRTVSGGKLWRRTLLRVPSATPNDIAVNFVTPTHGLA